MYFCQKSKNILCTFLAEMNQRFSNALKLNAQNTKKSSKTNLFFLCTSVKKNYSSSPPSANGFTRLTTPAKTTPNNNPKIKFTQIDCNAILSGVINSTVC